MGVSGTTTATTTIPSYEQPVRRDSFRPPSLEAADNSLALTGSLSPVDEQVCAVINCFTPCKTLESLGPTRMRVYLAFFLGLL